MPRDEVLRHLQSEINRLLAMCLKGREDEIRSAMGITLSHARCLWLVPSGRLSATRTTERDASGRHPLPVLIHTPEAHEKMKNRLTLGYPLQELINHASPIKVMFETNLRAWLLGGNYATLGEHLPLVDAFALLGVPAQGRPRGLIDSAVIHNRIKSDCRRHLGAPRVVC